MKKNNYDEEEVRDDPDPAYYYDSCDSCASTIPFILFSVPSVSLSHCVVHNFLKTVKIILLFLSYNSRENSLSLFQLSSDNLSI